MLYRLRRLLKSTGRELAVLWYACRHPATPLPVKAGALLLAAYLISPIDLIPDAIPILGWIDDVTLAALGVTAILKLVPLAALEDARRSGDRLLSKWAFWRSG